MRMKQSMAQDILNFSDELEMQSATLEEFRDQEDAIN